MIDELARRFIATYAQLNSDSMGLLADLYAEAIAFEDPFRRIDGLPALEVYLRDLYSNATGVRFECSEPALQADAAYIRWRLFFAHPRLNSGREIVVPGVSFIRGVDKVVEQQDYYDAAALLYEHLPLLGSAIRFIRHRMQPRDEHV